MSISIRHVLLRVGERLNSRALRGVKGAAKYLEVGYAMRQMGYPLRSVEKWVDRREELFDLVGKDVADRAVLYMEFGVFEGHATRYWSKLLKNPRATLHGFDSFEGLPEDWHEVKTVMKRSHFSTGGAVPVVDDPRVRFFKGWFDQTLPGYTVPEHEVLVINFDADLYSSTKCVFDKMGPHIVPGAWLYFDEFGCVQDELRAFREFAAQCRYKFALRGSCRAMQKVLFQCVA